MPNESEISASEISKWLDSAGHSREWLADQTGTHPGTVAGWLAPGKPRPIPIPTLKLIERLMCDDLLGAPNYSYAEAAVIRRAMVQEGYSSLQDFVRDAVVANAQRIMDAREKIVELSTTSTAAGGFTIMRRGSIAAGGRSSADVEETEIPVSKAYKADHYALRVSGRSMEPTIPDGSTIIVKAFKDQGFPRKGSIVVYNDGLGTTLKMFDYAPAQGDEEHARNGKIPVLRSINPEFPDVEPLEGGRIDAVLVEVV
ncbi:S24 family peptidase [Luteolibacter sp. GHJ8]|uniref:S24 family peptidase n=2 Tax=Luteolibacter rhizosphaerae TaxID=2989719 RepID=A0ABT3G805_9BACT|nr:S24 family peptidase [Luteolibacter rhizosphaerae]